MLELITPAPGTVVKIKKTESSKNSKYWNISATPLITGHKQMAQFQRYS